MYYPIIYTRTFYKDFRMICKPPTTVISGNLLAEFERFMRQIINTDKISNKQINVIRYSYLKIDRYILWGIGCVNTQIGIPNEYGIDCKHRSKLRSFIGIIFDQNSDIGQIGVPIVSSFFKEIFDRYVIPNWNFPEHKQWKIIDSHPMDDFAVTTIFPKDKMQINLSNEYCEVYSKDINIENLIASIITKETSLVTGLNVSSHILNAYQLGVCIQNATCIEESESRKIKFKPIDCLKNDEEYDDNKPKDSSLKQKRGSRFHFIEKIPNLFRSFSIEKREINSCNLANENYLIKTDPNTSKSYDQTDFNMDEKKTVDTESVKWTHFDKGKKNNSELLGTGCPLDKINSQESILMKWDDFGRDTKADEPIQENENLSSENTFIGELKEIKIEKPISEKYKALLSELKFSFSSIDNYNISSEQYIEIEGMAKELIKKINNLYQSQ